MLVAGRPCPCPRCSGPGPRRAPACGPGPSDGDDREPSESTRKDTSSPSRNSSITTWVSPKRRSSKNTPIASRASALRGHDHLLAGRQAVGLEDERVGGGDDPVEAPSCPRSTAWEVVVMPASSISSFAPGSPPPPGGGLAVGPKPNPLASVGSTRPATSGTLGPTMTRRLFPHHSWWWLSRAFDRPEPPSPRSALGGDSRRCPGCAHKSGVGGERPRARTSARSRPPPPTTQNRSKAPP